MISTKILKCSRTKFLQMELKTKNEIINNLLDSQSAVAETLSLEKQQNNQAASLAKQQAKINLHYIALNLPNHLEKACNSTSKANIIKITFMLTNIFKSNDINQASKWNKIARNYMSGIKHKRYRRRYKWVDWTQIYRVSAPKL